MKRKHTDEELASCAFREWSCRRRVYKRLVSAGKMAEADADHELSMMREISEFFQEKSQPTLI